MANNTFFPGPVVSGEWLREHLDQVAVADVRWSLSDGPKRDEFEAGHIPGAVFVDLDVDLSDPPGDRGRHPLPSVPAFRSVLTWPGYLFGFTGLLLVFATYSSVLTLVPFRLKQLDPAISEVTISLVYVGYLMGIVVALLSTRLRAHLRSDVNGILLGTGVSILGMTGLLISSVAGVFIAMLAMSTGFFLVHAMLSAFLNYAAPHSKGVVNGLYLSFYYAGGALGAYLPGFVLRAQGWTSYVLVLCSFFCVGVLCLLGLRRIRA